MTCVQSSGPRHRPWSLAIKTCGQRHSWGRSHRAKATSCPSLPLSWALCATQRQSCPLTGFSLLPSQDDRCCLPVHSTWVVSWALRATQPKDLLLKPITCTPIISTRDRPHCPLSYKPEDGRPLSSHYLPGLCGAPWFSTHRVFLPPASFPPSSPALHFHPLKTAINLHGFLPESSFIVSQCPRSRTQFP